MSDCQVSLVRFDRSGPSSAGTLLGLGDDKAATPENPVDGRERRHC